MNIFLKGEESCVHQVCPTQRAPDPLQSAQGPWWWESARFHLCLRLGAGRQFLWLKPGSVKAAFSRPTHQPSPGCYTTGNAHRWALAKDPYRE
jgi:hypothetical protein